MDHGMLTGLHEQMIVSEERKDNSFTEQYIQFVQDAFRVSAEHSKMQEGTAAQEKAWAVFYQQIGVCEMIWRVGTSAQALREKAYAGRYPAEDPRLQMLEEMQQELGKSLQELILVSGGERNLMQAVYDLQNHFFAAVITLKTEAGRKMQDTSVIPENDPETAAAIENPQASVQNKKMISDVKDCPFGQPMADLFAIDPQILPESAEAGGKTQKLRRELERIQEKAYSILEVTLEWYAPDENGRTRYLNRDDIDDLGTRYLDLNADLMDLEEAIKENEIGTFPLNVLSRLRDELSDHTTDFFNASYFAMTYTAKHEKSSVRIFSIYDLMGEVHPTGGNELLRYAKIVQEQAGALEGDQTAKAVAAELTELTKRVLPRILHERVGGGLFEPLESEELERIAEMCREEEAILTGYLRQISDTDEAADKAQKVFWKNVKEVRERISFMATLLAMLAGDDEGGRLTADIDRYVDEIMKRQKQAEEGEELEPLPYRKEEASRILFAMDCRQMAEQGVLIAGFLFGDPHAVKLLTAGFNIQILEEVEKTEKDVSAVPWTDGMRDLSDVPEYRRRLEREDDPGHILQYATKNDWEQFTDVVNDTLRYLPTYMKKVNILVSGKTSTMEINVGEMIRMEVEEWKESGESILTQMEDLGGFSGIVRRNAGMFTFEDPQDGARVVGFLERLQRNLINAGLGMDAQRALSDPAIPDGYNESVARMCVDLLFGNLNRTVRHNLLTEEKFALAKDRGRKARYMNVTLSYMRGNADASVLDERVFFTTTEDFRFSDFVGKYLETGQYPQRVRAALEGLDETELREVFSEKRQRQFGYETDQRINEARKELAGAQENILLRMQQGLSEDGCPEVLIKEETYARAEYIADMADLQVIDYLTGVGLRSTDDLRLAFRNEDGKIRFCGISGADRITTRPYTRHSEEDEKKMLVHPEAMRVMTKDMYEKLLRWKKGMEDPTGIRLSDAEKKVLSELDHEAGEGMQRRLFRLMSFTEDPQTEQYADRKRKLLGREYAPDLKQGRIRVLERDDFTGLKLADLTGGEEKNLFDVMAELPSRCADAILDKWVALLSGADGKKFGEGLGSAAEIMYHGQKWVYDLAVNNSKAEQLCINSEGFYGDIAVLHEEAAQKGNALARLLDGGSFQSVETAAKMLQQTIRDNRRLAELDREMACCGEEGLSAEELDMVHSYREERLAYAQRLADMQGHSYPDELPAISLDPHLYFRTIKELDQFRERLREYLEKRRVSVTESGRERMVALVDLFNRVNQSISAYAHLTGDTNAVPQNAKITDEKAGTVAFSDMYSDAAAYESITPYYYDTERKKKTAAEKKRAVTRNDDNGSDTEGKTEQRTRMTEQRQRIGLNDLMKK